MTLPPVAAADPQDCDETLAGYDPYDLVFDSDVLLDLSTLIEVKNLVDDYTQPRVGPAVGSRNS